MVPVPGQSPCPGPNCGVGVSTVITGLGWGSHTLERERPPGYRGTSGHLRIELFVSPCLPLPDSCPTLPRFHPFLGV